MLMKVKYDNWENSEANVTVTDICPNCGRGIEPILKDSSFYKDEDRHILFLTLFCNSCKYAWVDSYDYLSNYDDAIPRNLHYYKELPSEFPKEISELSPQGVKTYTQSLQAEVDGYDTLVGIGLRKSLEFIIKDYLIYRFPEKTDEIKMNYETEAQRNDNFTNNKGETINHGVDNSGKSLQKDDYVGFVNSDDEEPK